MGVERRAYLFMFRRRELLCLIIGRGNPCGRTLRIDITQEKEIS